MKRLIESALVLSRIPDMLAATRRVHGVILGYHNVVPVGERPVGDRSLHMPQRDFARQLDLVGQLFDVVPLEELRIGTPGKPRAAITFDDAYLGALSAGVEELARRAMPATVFVAPKFLGGGTFWWDELADPVTGILAPSLRETALGQLKGRHDEIVAWAGHNDLRRASPPAHACVASEVVLRDVTHAGVTLGSHTWSHPNLARLRGPELGRELGPPLKWLRERFDAVIPWLAYPYGLASPEVEAAVRGAGYTNAVRVTGGVLRSIATDDAYRMPRCNIPAGISIDGFQIRLRGFLGSR